MTAARIVYGRGEGTVVDILRVGEREKTGLEWKARWIVERVDSRKDEQRSIRLGVSKRCKEVQSRVRGRGES